MAETKLTDEEKQQLLELARKTISHKLQHGKAEDCQAVEGNLAEPCGAFVSLHMHGNLRGCIGTFVSQRPLVNTIQEMAVSASQRDPRFPSMTPEELKDVDIEISVLSPLKEISDVSEIEVGRHGIYITKGFYSGVLLPQVASEYGWDRDTFLEHTCTKAGLPPNAWKEKGTKIEIFEAQVFGEKPK
jgi:AmmeMemoRadiSam system protein A